MDRREELSWPDGAKIVVAPVVAWETWPDNLGTPESNQRTNRPPLPTGAKYNVDTWVIRDHLYAESEGIWRLLDLFDRLDIKVSILANGKTIEDFPDIAREALSRGHDLASEGYIHEYSVMLDESQERESIERTVATYEEVLGVSPLGYISPGHRATPNTASILVDNGYLWDASHDEHDYPHVSTVNGRPLVEMPYGLVDYQTYAYAGRTPRELAQMLADEFDALYDEGLRGYPRMLGYAFHPFLSRGYRVRPIEEFFSSIRENADIWFATRTDVAQWVLKQRSPSP